MDRTSRPSPTLALIFSVSSRSEDFVDWFQPAAHQSFHDAVTSWSLQLFLLLLSPNFAHCVCHFLALLPNQTRSYDLVSWSPTSHPFPIGHAPKRRQSEEEAARFRCPTYFRHGHEGRIQLLKEMTAEQLVDAVPQHFCSESSTLKNGQPAFGQESLERSYFQSLRRSLPQEPKQLFC